MSFTAWGSHGLRYSGFRDPWQPLRGVPSALLHFTPDQTISEVIHMLSSSSAPHSCMFSKNKTQLLVIRFVLRVCDIHKACWVSLGAASNATGC